MVWAIEGVFAVVFLCWFGNAMADRYRRLYGNLPEVKPEPVYRETEPEREPVRYESPGAYTTVCSSMWSVTVPYDYGRGYRFTASSLEDPRGIWVKE